jgi:hypothetical protein
MEAVKTCSKCKETKAVSEFHKRVKSNDGLSYQCKTCAALASKNPVGGRVTRGYWEKKENVIEAASKSETISEFSKSFPGAIASATKHGWINDIKPFFKETKKPSGFWTKERCHEDSIQCNTRAEYAKRFPISSGASYKGGWINDICGHMETFSRPVGYWDAKENVIAAANSCKTRSEFRKKFPGAVVKAIEFGWLDEVCSHLEYVNKKPGTWERGACHNVSIGCKTRSEFRGKEPGAYYSAWVNGWLDDICSHMTDGKNLRGIFEGKMICPKCKVDLDLSNFSKNRSSKIGYQGQCKSCTSEYVKNNSGKYLHWGSKRRARKRNAIPEKSNKKLIKAIYAYQQKRRSDEPLFNWHIDHIIPLNAGGLHHEENLQLLMQKHNCQKGDKADWHDQPFNIGIARTVNDPAFWDFVADRGLDVDGATLYDYLVIQGG